MTAEVGAFPSSPLPPPLPMRLRRPSPQLAARVGFVALQALDQLFSCVFYAGAYLGGIQEGFKRKLEHKLLYGITPPSRISLDNVRFEIPSHRVEVAGQVLLAHAVPYGVEGGLLGVASVLALCDRIYALAMGTVGSGRLWMGCIATVSYVGLIFKQFAAEQSGERFGELLWDHAGEPVWQRAAKVHAVAENVMSKVYHSLVEAAPDGWEDTPARPWSFIVSKGTNQTLYFALVIFEKGFSALSNPLAFGAGLSGGILIGLARRAVRIHAAKMKDREPGERTRIGEIYANAVAAVSKKKSACAIEKELRLFDDPTVSKVGFLVTKILDAFGYWLSAQAVLGIGRVGELGATALLGRVKWLPSMPDWFRPIASFVAPRQIAAALLAFPILEIVAVSHGKDTGEFLVKIGGDAVTALVDRYFPESEPAVNGKSIQT